VNIADGKVGRKGQHRGKDEEGTREKAARSTRRSGTMIEHSSLHQSHARTVANLHFTCYGRRAARPVNGSPEVPPKIKKAWAAM